MAGFAERYHEKGMQQGRIEGERAVLERLLQRRFGPLSPDIAEKLSKASTVDLETWADNVLDAETFDDVGALSVPPKTRPNFTPVRNVG